jgi:hypothetical protein
MYDYQGKSIRQEPSKIMEGLYLSGFYEARQKEVLESLGITHILVAGNNLSKVYPEVSWYSNYRISSTDNIN